MDHQAMLAVIINCYNYAEFVGRAIKSVQVQNRPDCELIVVDDGSTDGSWDEISKTGATAYRIGNRGQRYACLYGLERSTAPFVMFLDADDELLPGALDTIMPYLQPAVAKLQFCLERVDRNNNLLGSAVPDPGTIAYRGDLSQRVLRTGVYVSPPTSGNVFRRDVCELLKDAGYDSAVDGIIILAAPFYGKVVSLREKLGLYRIHARNKSGAGRGVERRQIEEELRRFEKRFDHLRDVIRTKGSNLAGLDCRRTFFHAEKTFLLAILNGASTRFGLLIPLIGITFRDFFPLHRKLILSAFFVLATLLPPALATLAVDLRYRPEKRKASLVLKALMGQLQPSRL